MTICHHVSSNENPNRSGTEAMCSTWQVFVRKVKSAQVGEKSMTVYRPRCHHGKYKKKWPVPETGCYLKVDCRGRRRVESTATMQRHAMLHNIYRIWFRTLSSSPKFTSSQVTDRSLNSLPLVQDLFELFILISLEWEFLKFYGRNLPKNGSESYELETIPPDYCTL